MGISTRTALMTWGYGHEKSEYLAIQILRIEKYTNLDPIHPQGGPDGRGDIICTDPQGLRCVVGVWFPRDSATKSLREAAKKFTHDLAGVKLKQVKGFVFVTNKELPLSERNKLILAATRQGCETCEIYHLERLYPILDSAMGYGLRLDVLGIKMKREEMVSFVATHQQLTTALIDAQTTALREMLSATFAQALERKTAVKRSPRSSRRKKSP